MSQNTCKFLLVLSVVLLVLINILVPSVEVCPIFGISRWLSTVLCIVFLTGISLFLSYMNRSVFVVSSDKVTLPLIFLLTVFSDSGTMTFSKCHIVALLSLFAICFMLRFLITERISKSDYFIWCLLISVSSILIPQMVWLLIPGLLVSMDKFREYKMKHLSITVGAVLTPLAYLSAYSFFINGNDWFVLLSDWFDSAISLRPPKVYSMVRIFYFTVMGVVLLSAVFTIFSRYDEIRNTNMRKQSRFIFPYLFILTVIILTGDFQDGSKIMIFAVPWSLLFLYYGELSSYTKGWTHLVLLTIVSTMVLRVYEIF